MKNTSIDKLFIIASFFFHEINIIGVYNVAIQNIKTTQTFFIFSHYNIAARESGPLCYLFNEKVFDAVREGGG